MPSASAPVNSGTTEFQSCDNSIENGMNPMTLCVVIAGCASVGELSVDSTASAVAVGDRRWREIRNGHHDVIRRGLSRFSGSEVDTSGDGFFATFDGPARAIRCALEITERVHDLGIEVRAGVHTGLAWVGAVGDEAHTEVTALGDAVNVEDGPQVVGKEKVRGFIIIGCARGGFLLKFNAFDATFSLAHYYTYFDIPALQVSTM
jgi:hypothetical protein